MSGFVFGCLDVYLDVWTYILDTVYSLGVCILVACLYNCWESLLGVSTACYDPGHLFLKSDVFGCCGQRTLMYVNIHKWCMLVEDRSGISGHS